MPPSSPITDPGAPPRAVRGGAARLVRLLFWTVQGLVLLGIVMVLAGLVIEDASPAAPILKVLVLPIGLLPVLGPVWVVVTPVLLILMLLTRRRRLSSG